MEEKDDENTDSTSKVQNIQQDNDRPVNYKVRPTVCAKSLVDFYMVSCYRKIDYI